MKNAFIFHGAFGSPEENWIPWLKSNLEEQGYTVTTPQFPTPEGQNYENWMQVIEPHLAEMNEHTLLIGHSIGATFICCVLEKIQQPVTKAVMVSGFLGLLGDEVFDRVNETISAREFDWEVVKRNVAEFHIFHGSDDPYVPVEYTEVFGQKLDVRPVIIENGGHLNEAAGFTVFPQLLESIVN